jgi:hypothetical protein
LLHDLNGILVFTSLLGAELRTRVAQCPPGASRRAAFRAAADRYDRFLDDYEGLWNSIRRQLQLIDEGPARASGGSFARLGALEVRSA